MQSQREGIKTLRKPVQICASIALGLTLTAFASTTSKAEDMRDPVMVEYVRRVMHEEGFAVGEFMRFAEQNPPLAGYFLATAAHAKCGFSAPSERLSRFADVENVLKTDDGMKIFAASVAVSSRAYPTPNGMSDFCENAKVLAETSETEAAK